MMRGRNALVVLMREKTFKSNKSRALVRSRSMSGIEYPAPALFNSVSSEPPVSFSTSETHFEIDSSERVSSWSVSIPAASTDFSFVRLRADAKTRHPALWKARARCEPRLPSEQPVMRTVLSEEEEAIKKKFAVEEVEIGVGWEYLTSGGELRTPLTTSNFQSPHVESEERQKNSNLSF